MSAETIRAQVIRLLPEALAGTDADHRLKAREIVERLRKAGVEAKDATICMTLSGLVGNMHAGIRKAPGKIGYYYSPQPGRSLLERKAAIAYSAAKAYDQIKGDVKIPALDAVFDRLMLLDDGEYQRRIWGRC